MNALVFGGTRFVGRLLVEQLLEAGATVTLLHTGNRDPFGARVEHLVVDRDDRMAVQRHLKGRTFTHVFDHAYIQPHGTQAAHVRQALELLGEHVKRYLFTSSVAAYEVGLERREGDSLATRGDPYSEHKIACERELSAWAKATGGQFTAIRPASIIGPFNRGYQLRFFWDRLRANLPIILPDGGTSLMQFAYGPDVASVLLRLAQTPEAAGEVYNVAWPETISQRAFVEALAEVSGHVPRFKTVPRTVIEACGGSPFNAPLYFGESLDVVGALGAFSVTPHKLIETLGFEITPWRSALEETYAWYGSLRESPLTQSTPFELEVIGRAAVGAS